MSHVSSGRCEADSALHEVGNVQHSKKLNNWGKISTKQLRNYSLGNVQQSKSDGINSSALKSCTREPAKLGDGGKTRRVQGLEPFLRT